MAAGNQKPKPDAAPVHPWDLPPEPIDDGEFEDAGPRTIVSREPGPPKKTGEVLESFVPEPDPLGGPATLPGGPPVTAPGNVPVPVGGEVVEPPPLTAFDSQPQPVFDPPTFADRSAAAKIPPTGLSTEPTTLPPVTAPQLLPEGTQPQIAVPSAPPEKKTGPSTEAQTAATPIRKITGDLAKSAEAVRKSPSNPSAPKKTTGELKSAAGVRKTTGELKSAEGVRKATGDIRSAQAVRKATGDIKSAGELRKAASKPSGRLPRLADSEDTTKKKLGDQETRILTSDVAEELERQKPREKPAPPVAGLGSAQDDEDSQSSVETAERTAVKQVGAFGRSRMEKDPTAPDANLGDPDLYERTKTGVRVQAPRAKKRLAAAVALVAVLLGAFLLHSLYQGAREQPTLPELYACYPYGFEGARGPHGEDAPGAEFMKYDLVGEVPCESHPVCLRYRYTGQNRFTGTMVVGKAQTGTWERLGDQGCPFPPRRAE